MDSINTKLDRIIELLEKMQIPVAIEKKQIIPNSWSIENYKNSILIKFPFNDSFKNYIKELGGQWMLGKKSWVFPKLSEESVIDSIKERYSEWTFTDLRE
jgi:hypothetical protein